MTEELIHKIGRLSHSAATALHVKSALNPLLWLTVISTPTCFCAAYFFKDDNYLKILLVKAGLFPIGVACLGFIYFALFKPEKLQSEDYQIRHESLQIIQQKSGSIEITGTSINQIANPVSGQIEHKVNEQ
jgi:hypothetical protein